MLIVGLVFRVKSQSKLTVDDQFRLSFQELVEMQTWSKTQKQIGTIFSLSGVLVAAIGYGLFLSLYLKA